MEFADIIGAMGIFILCLSVSALTMYVLHKLDKREQERYREGKRKK